MTDPRFQTCGQCRHFRPAQNVCGGALPEVKIFGSLQKEDGTVEPLFGTFRPEVHEEDPSCFMFEEHGMPSLKDVLVEKERSPICEVPGCKCMRDGESPFCVDHEDYEEPEPQPIEEAE